ncbi:hypothetical protein [Desulfatirhabdium butyrativorans]|uniref:F0F1 ATP synthase subunit B family protein n=1 Tax=Desulfatirhabdium butyrativorans TaxID=340467 RepID=UPI000421F5BF|nr:hypothetical protein [Desulfatirhabdium butyrativorans]
MEIINKVALITINETFFFQLLSFLLFMVIVTRVMFRPLQGVMNNRQTHIEKLKADVVDADQEVLRLTKAIAEQEAAAKAEAIEMRANIEHEGVAAGEAILFETQQKLAQEREKALEQVNQTIATIREQLQSEADALSVFMIEKLLDRKVEA